MTDKNLTEIVAIIDRSGSMESLAADTIGGFNSFLESQKKTGGRAVITRVQFDNQYQIDYEGVDVNDAPTLNRDVYQPRGSTALFDAVARTVTAVGQRLAQTPEDQRPGQVIFVIITDGFENASQEFHARSGGDAKVRAMVSHQIEKYGWTFVYLGGGDLDSQKAQGASLGIRSANVYAYSANSAGTQAVYGSVGASLGRRRIAVADGVNFSADASVLNEVEVQSLVTPTTTKP